MRLSFYPNTWNTKHSPSISSGEMLIGWRKCKENMENLERKTLVFAKDLANKPTMYEVQSHNGFFIPL